MKNFFVSLVCSSLFLTFSSGAIASSGLVSMKSLEDGRLVLSTVLGQTLYTFDIDADTGSNCNGVCAEKWPPMIVSEEEASRLSNGFSVTPRDSGLLQLSYQGSPLYLFYLDRGNQDSLGDGLGGVWHVATSSCR